MFWPTDVRPRVAGLVVSQALWICSLQVGRPRSTAALMNISRHQFDSNSIPPDHRNGTLPTDHARCSIGYNLARCCASERGAMYRVSAKVAAAWQGAAVRMTS